MGNFFQNLGNGIGTFFEGIGNYIGTTASDPLGQFGRVGDLLSGKNFFDVYDRPFTDLFGGETAKQAKYTEDDQLSDLRSLAQDIQSGNNDLQMQRDELDRKFNQDSANTAMQFEAAENQKNRDWQTEMSNTAYQRAVADLKAAGLSPMLMYMQGGSGASTPSGGAATGKQASHQSQQVDTSTVRSLVESYLTTARTVQSDTLNSATRLISALILGGALSGSSGRYHSSNIGFRS